MYIGGCKPPVQPNSTCNRQWWRCVPHVFMHRLNVLAHIVDVADELCFDVNSCSPIKVIE